MFTYPEFFDEAFQLAHDAIIPSVSELEEMLRNLAARHPDKIQWNGEGKSRNGRPILCAKVGHGPKVVCVTGGAHSDEPVGSVTCQELVRMLVTHADFAPLLQTHTFLVHPMLDPDGAAINEKWTRQAFDYRSFLLHGFRNNHPSEDCEHGVPLQATQTARPEISAFLKNVSNVDGNFVCYFTLHTTHRLGGSLFVVTSKDLSPVFQRYIAKMCDAEGVPVTCLDLRGEDGMLLLEPGFIVAPRVSDLAKKYADREDILAQIKMTTYEYMETVKGAPVSIISELPSVIDARLDDLNLTDLPLFEVKKQLHEAKVSGLEPWRTAIAKLESFGLDEKSIWLKQAKFRVKMRSSMNFDEGEEQQACKNQKAFVFERVDLLEEPLLDRLELAKYEYNALAELPGAEKHRIEALERFNACYEELFSQVTLEPVTLETQVRIQLKLIFAGLQV